jgi:hypothetical protein
MKGTKQDGHLGALWPPGRLELGEWRELLEALAADAERMIGRPGDLQQSCALALRWVGLAWPAMSAEVIAASCRASLQLADPPGVVVGLPLADQLQEIAERLDSIYEAAQADPGALAVEVLPPVLMAPPGVLPEMEPPKPRKPRRCGDADPAEVDGANSDPVEVIEQEAQALAADESEALEVIELPADLEPQPEPVELPDMWADAEAPEVEHPALLVEHPEVLEEAEPLQPEVLPVEAEPVEAQALELEPEPEPDALEEQQPEQPEPVDDSAEDEAQLLPSWATEALEVAPADPAPLELEQQPEPEPEAQPLDTSQVEGMPPGWGDSVELAAAAGLNGISGLTRLRGSGQLLEGIHWKQAPPGLRPPGGRRRLKWIYHLAPCLEALGPADPSSRLSSEQLRAQVRAGIREQGHRRRQRRQLATDTLAELQAEGQALEVIEPLQQPKPPAAPPDVPPDVLAVAVAQALQQLGITPPPVPSSNGHREPAPSCWTE